LFDEDEEETNLCLMTHIAFEESKLDQKDEINIDDLESLKKDY